MKAVIVKQPYGIDNVHIVELPHPGPPGPKQVLLRVTAGSLNYRDIMIAFGLSFEAPTGRIMGSDVTGVIEAVGSEVTGHAVGDRVNPTFNPTWLSGSVAEEKVGIGGYGGVRRHGLWAEHVLVDAEVLVPAPIGFSDVEAAAVVCAGLTAWNALTWTGTIGPEGRDSLQVAGDAQQVLLVEGTGGVSVFGMQLAHAAGVKVIVTSSSDAKLQRARELGAWATINYKTHPDWHAEVIRLTQGRGADHVLEVGGGRATLVPALRATAWGGTVSLIGGLDADDGLIDVNLLDGGKRLQVIETGSRDMLRATGAFMVEKKIRPEIAKVYPFEQIKAALLYLKEQKAVGKVCWEMTQ